MSHQNWWHIQKKYFPEWKPLTRNIQIEYKLNDLAQKDLNNSIPYQSSHFNTRSTRVVLIKDKISNKGHWKKHEPNDPISELPFLLIVTNNHHLSSTHQHSVHQQLHTHTPEQQKRFTSSTGNNVEQNSRGWKIWTWFGIRNALERKVAVMGKGSFSRSVLVFLYHSFCKSFHSPVKMITALSLLLITQP